MNVSILVHDFKFKLSSALEKVLEKYSYLGNCLT